MHFSKYNFSFDYFWVLGKYICGSVKKNNEKYDRVKKTWQNSWLQFQFFMFLKRKAKRFGLNELFRFHSLKILILFCFLISFRQESSMRKLKRRRKRWRWLLPWFLTRTCLRMNPRDPTSWILFFPLLNHYLFNRKEGNILNIINNDIYWFLFFFLSFL